MKVSRVKVLNWGPFESKDLCLHEGAHFILGGNESGKSWFVRGLWVGLFGMDPSSELKKECESLKRTWEISVVFRSSSADYCLTRVYDGHHEAVQLLRTKEGKERKLTEIPGEVHRFLCKEMGVGSSEVLVLYAMEPMSLIREDGIRSVVHAYEGLGRKDGFISFGDASQRIRKSWLSEKGRASEERLRALKASIHSHQAELEQWSGTRDAYSQAMENRSRLMDERDKMEQERDHLEERKTAALRRSAAQEQLRRWRERREELEQMLGSLMRTRDRLENVNARLDALNRLRDSDLDEIAGRLSDLRKNIDSVSWKLGSCEDARGRLEEEKANLEEQDPGILALAENPGRMEALSGTLSDVEGCRERLERVQRALSNPGKSKLGRGWKGRILEAIFSREELEELREIESRLMVEMERLDGALRLEMSGISEIIPRTALQKALEMRTRLEEWTARQRELEGVHAELAVRLQSLENRKRDLFNETGTHDEDDLELKIRTVATLRSERSGWEDALKEGMASKGVETLKDEVENARDREKRLVEDMRSLDGYEWKEEQEIQLRCVQERLEILVQEISSEGERAMVFRDRLGMGEAQISGRIAHLNDEVERLQRSRFAAERAVQILMELEDETRSRTIPLLEREVERRLSILTNGRHTRMSLCSPWPSFTIRLDDQSAWPVARFGTGTQWAASVAMQLAVYSLFDPHAFTPLILDAPFHALDDDRRKALLCLLSQEAKRGRQILCFTQWEGLEAVSQDSVPGAGWRCTRLNTPMDSQLDRSVSPG